MRLQVETNTLLAHTLERRSVQKYDVAAPITLVPVSIRDGSHDFKTSIFDAVRAANDGCWLVHGCFRWSFYASFSLVASPLAFQHPNRFRGDPEADSGEVVLRRDIGCHHSDFWIDFGRSLQSPPLHSPMQSNTILLGPMQRLTGCPIRGSHCGSDHRASGVRAVLVLSVITLAMWGAVVLSEFVATFGILSVIWGCSRLRSGAGRSFVGGGFASRP